MHPFRGYWLQHGTKLIDRIYPKNLTVGSGKAYASTLLRVRLTAVSVWTVDCARLAATFVFNSSLTNRSTSGRVLNTRSPLAIFRRPAILRRSPSRCHRQITTRIFGD